MEKITWDGWVSSVGEDVPHAALDALSRCRRLVRIMAREYKGRDLDVVTDLIDDAAYTLGCALASGDDTDKVERLLEEYGLK